VCLLQLLIGDADKQQVVRPRAAHLGVNAGTCQ